MAILLRPYRPQDASATLQVFSSAVLLGAAADYSTEELRAWAGAPCDHSAWHENRTGPGTIVAELSGQIVGFTEIDLQDNPGYINMLFVHPDHTRQGVGHTLLDWAIAAARKSGIKQVSTHASLTARPVFAAHGFEVVETCAPVIRGVTLQNFFMTKDLFQIPR